MNLINKFFILLCLIIAVGYPGIIASQSVTDLDNEAEAFFEKKEFSKAIGIWLSILDSDPENEKIQKKIEMIYLLKQQKDLSMQKAKINYKISRKILTKNQKSDDLKSEEIEKNLNEIFTKSKIAIESFIIAYRIDPKDPEFIDMKDDMKRLNDEVEIEKKKDQLSRQLKERNLKLRILAKKMMDQENYEKALEYWNEILSFLPKESVASEGKRTCTLAIENRLKFEKIKSFTATGKKLFIELNYKDARLAFLEVVNLDPKNSDARDFIEQIDEKLEAKRNYEITKLQAEEFYNSGINSLNNNRFDQAKEELENTLAIIDNYKDARERLKSIDRLRKDYENKEKAVKLERINKEFQNGLIALSEGKYKEAISAFEITLSLDSKNELAKNYIARAKDAQQQIEDERVDKNSPYYEIIESLIITGKNLYNKGNFQESRKNWEKILSLFPKNKMATEYTMRIDLRLNPETYKIFSLRYVKEGEELLKKRDFNAALNKFEMIKSISDNYPGIDNLISRARDGLKTTGGVVSFASIKTTVLSAVEKTEINRRYELGLNLYERGGKENIEKALAEFQYVVQNDPENIKAIINVNKIQAQLRIGSGIVGEARIKLTAEQESLIRKHYYLGINYYTNNDLQRALAEWRKVLAIDPNHIQAKNNIRKVLVFIGR